MPTMPSPERSPRRSRFAWLVVGLVVAVLAASCSDTSTRRPATEHVHADTQFGTNVWEAPGEDQAAAMARLDATFGHLPVVRVFSTWPPTPWPALQHDVGRRSVVVSFKIRPSVILSGAADDRLRTWFSAAPTDHDVYWVYYHEPEAAVEGGELNADRFVQAWNHVAALAEESGNPRLHATLVLMCWTMQARSGRDWRDYLPEPSLVDVLAWDCYAKGADSRSYADVASLLDPTIEASRAAGAKWAIAELGARIAPGANGDDRAQWLSEVGAYAHGHGAAFVTYFDAPIGGSFRLTDLPSVRVWTRLVASSRRRAPERRRPEEQA
jgi:hypothetical protein